MCPRGRDAAASEPEAEARRVEELAVLERVVDGLLLVEEELVLGGDEQERGALQVDLDARFGVSPYR